MRNSREAVKLTASDAVYETLRHKIMNNQLPGGSQLLEEEVATQLNVSRTPVPAAFSTLPADHGAGHPRDLPDPLAAGDGGGRVAGREESQRAGSAGAAGMRGPHGRGAPAQRPAGLG